MNRQLFRVGISAACSWVVMGCATRTVIQRLPIPGHPTKEVVIAQLKSGGETWYRVETPDGSYTKEWVKATDTTPEEIRKNCRVEYDGGTLRVLGPRPQDEYDIGGYRID